MDLQVLHPRTSPAGKLEFTVPGVKTPKTFQKKRQKQGPQWRKGYRSLRLLGENPALVVVKQWRRPAAAAFCAGCAKGSSSPE